MTSKSNQISTSSRDPGGLAGKLTGPSITSKLTLGCRIGPRFDWPAAGDKCRARHPQALARWPRLGGARWSSGAGGAVAVAHRRPWSLEWLDHGAGPRTRGRAGCWYGTGAYRLPQTTYRKPQTTDGVSQPGGTVGEEEGIAARLGLVSYGTNAVTLGVSGQCWRCQAEFCWAIVGLVILVILLPLQPIALPLLFVGFGLWNSIWFSSPPLISHSLDKDHGVGLTSSILLVLLTTKAVRKEENHYIPKAKFVDDVIVIRCTWTTPSVETDKL
ncbi:hypothetical protein I7I51_06456 [Histoplasma capsulatum]|uniref:Uncharacterized protein n=1 Tax=Ajellomyces capsulatus TaxID=5037 RepID=A0A8A1MKG7_AJECA|nr:hypothetical protein I7I51_06456 [Histoplasma capsulatum]